jgi:multicomponent Na+:H+ antiporter subunit E
LRKTKLSAVIATFLVCFAFWLLLTWSVKPQELIAGAVVSLAAALFSARFFIHEKAFWLANPAKFFTGLCYWLFVFPGELIKANCHMAKVVLGGCKVKPGIVKIPSGLKSGYGRAALANSITLTPGTITMEITEEEDQTWYYVHWIEAETDGAEAGETIKGRMEKWIRRFWK